MILKSQKQCIKIHMYSKPNCVTSRLAIVIINKIKGHDSELSFITNTFMH